jgi:hypothetical protein
MARRRNLVRQEAVQYCINGKSMTFLDPETDRLIAATIERFVSPVSRIERIQALPIKSGITDVEISRALVNYLDEAGNPQQSRFVLKNASLVERRVLDRLQSAINPHVPFNHSLHPDSKGSSWVCMQDLGETYRPNSLESITPGLQKREAEALAGIHLANLGASDLDWLPRADREYFDWAIERHFFRPAWTTALQSPDFVDRFGSYLDIVERAANSIVDGMVTLDAGTSTRTLIHSDINPSNVLVVEDVPYIIDWGTAHVGSLYLDLPHHFSTLEQAETCRLAMAERGLAIDPDTFSRAYRIAARYTALRYIWWALDAWQQDHTIEPWVTHYLEMIVANTEELP